jgi:hypothetical protein
MKKSSRISNDDPVVSAWLIERGGSCSALASNLSESCNAGRIENTHLEKEKMSALTGRATLPMGEPSKGNTEPKKKKKKMTCVRDELRVCKNAETKLKHKTDIDNKWLD